MDDVTGNKALAAVYRLECYGSCSRSCSRMCDLLPVRVVCCDLQDVRDFDDYPIL